MKLTQTLLWATVVATMVFATDKASAFPLKLTSLSGTISATPSYSAIESTNKAHYITKSFNLKQVTLLISNSIVQLGMTNIPPANAYFAYNPYNDNTYLTNSSGYYQSTTNLNALNFLSMHIEDTTAAFTTGTSSVNENDKIVFEFFFRATGTNGNVYYAGADYGSGTLHYGETSSKVSMTVSGKGVDYGEYASSDDGVSSLSFVFSGSAAQAEWSGPFCLWWEENFQ
jgi:hypothetical protein